MAVTTYVLCGAPETFSFPLAGSTLIVTFLGLGVLVSVVGFVLSAMASIVVCLVMTSTCPRARGVWLIWLRTVAVLVIDCRLPCIGQALARALGIGLLMPTVSLHKQESAG